MAHWIVARTIWGRKGIYHIVFPAMAGNRYKTLCGKLPLGLDGESKTSSPHDAADCKTCLRVFSGLSFDNSSTTYQPRQDMTASLADNFEELHNADDAEEIFEELLRKLEDFEPEDRRAILGSFVDQCNEKLQEIEDVFLDDEDED